MAAQNGHLETVKLLLEKVPATAQVQNNNGATPMYIAAQNGHIETVDLLMEKAPATAEVQEINGLTPLHTAAQEGHLETVKLLLEKAPATAEVQSKNGSTPLYIAAKNGHLDTVKLLLEKAPATAEVLNKDGDTPMYIAAQRGHNAIAQVPFENMPETIRDLGTEGRGPIKIIPKNRYENSVEEIFSKLFKNESGIAHLDDKVDKQVGLSKSMTQTGPGTAGTAYSSDASGGIGMSGDNEQHQLTNCRDLKDAIPHDFLLEIAILDPSASSNPYSGHDEAIVRYQYLYIS
jgi:uncharacterized protein (DUF1697 family)